MMPSSILPSLDGDTASTQHCRLILCQQRSARQSLLLTSSDHHLTSRSAASSQRPGLEALTTPLILSCHLCFSFLISSPSHSQHQQQRLQSHPSPACCLSSTLPTAAASSHQHADSASLSFSVHCTRAGSTCVPLVCRHSDHAVTAVPALALQLGHSLVGLTACLPNCGAGQPAHAVDLASARQCCVRLLVVVILGSTQLFSVCTVRLRASRCSQAGVGVGQQSSIASAVSTLLGSHLQRRIGCLACGGCGRAAFAASCCVPEPLPSVLAVPHIDLSLLLSAAVVLLLCFLPHCGGSRPRLPPRAL